MSLHISLLPRKHTRARLWKTLSAFVGVTTILNVSMVGALIAPRAASAIAVNNVPNPSIGQSCGLDISLVVDRSGSIDTSEMAQFKTGLKSFVDTFAGTPTDFSVTKFSTNAQVVQPFTTNTASVKAGIDSIPAYNGANGDGTTNWEDGLLKGFSTFDPRPDTDHKNLIVVATDGSPNTFNPGSSISLDWPGGLTHAVTQANAIKTAGTRIVVISIGQDSADPTYNGLDSTWNNPKLTAISGSTIANSSGDITVNTDVIKIDNFSGLGSVLLPFATSLCSGSLKVNKVVDSGTASADQFGFRLDNKDTFTYPASGQNSVTFDALPVGQTYSVEENLVAGYHQVSSTCSEVTIVGGQTTECTIHNARDMGTVTIVKEVVGGPAKPGDFTFTINGQTYHSGDEVTLPTGPYQVTETPVAKYTLQSATGACYDDGGIFIDTGRDASTCTITNVYQPSAPSLTIKKTDGHLTAKPGEALTYTITVSNAGETAATNVKIDDTLPSFLSAPTDISNSGVFAAGHIVWNNQTVPANGDLVLTFKATVNPTMPVGTTVLHNEAKLGCSEPIREQETFAVAVDAVCPYTGTAIDETSVTVVAPSLTITKTNNVSGFTNPGKTVIYTIVVTNSASATYPAAAVNLNDTLPTGFSYLLGGGSVRTFFLGDIAPGVSVTTTYVVNINAAQVAGVYTNTATAQGSNTAVVTASSNVEVRTPTVLGVTAAPTMTVTKTVDTAITNPGKSVTYTVTISNPGDVDLTEVTLNDTLPTGFTFADTGKGSKAWTIGTLKAHHQRVINYLVNVGADVKAGTYKNSATVLTKELDPQTTSANVEIRIPQVLGLATTGPSAKDYAIFIFGLGALSLGAFWVTRLRRHADGTNRA